MLIDLWHEERLDEAETLGFTIPASDPKAEWVVADAEFRWRNYRFFMQEIETVREDAAAYVRVEADALWYRLGESTHPGSFILLDVNTQDGLEAIVSATDWTVDAGLTTEAADTFSMEEQDLTFLALIRRWATITNTFVKFDTLNRKVSLLTERGVDRGIGFRYGRNMTGIQQRINPPQCTVLYPFGRDGLNIAGLNGGEQFLEDFSYYTDQGLTLEEARARYTKRRNIYEESIVTDTALLAYGERMLEELAQPTISYECTVLDLSELINTDDLYAIKLADRVRVFDSTLGFNVYTTVTRLKRFPLEPWKNEIELSFTPPLVSTSGSTSRPQASIQWLMFKSDNRAEYRLRNNGSYITNRIALRFREDGEAVYGYDLFATGVGTGTLGVSAYDAESGELAHRALSIPYVDGQVIHENLTWAEKELSGQYDYRIRIVATASGASSASGVDLELAESRFWILAHGATQQTPTTDNSIRYDYTGAVQEFIIPDNVTNITLEVHGSRGGGASIGGDNEGGHGAKVSGQLSVIPGTIYDVYVGGFAGNSAAGWPNGGSGDTVSGSDGFGGGGSSHFVPSGGAVIDAIIVAAGGGGGGADSGSNTEFVGGGDGGFFLGTDGGAKASKFYSRGIGATQFAGGAGGWQISFGAEFPDAGEAGSFGQGGDAADTGNNLSFPGGGGGGGWYGGGGAGNAAGNGMYAGGGGGGSGWHHADVTEIEIEDAENFDYGYIIVSWDTPDIG